MPHSSRSTSAPPAADDCEARDALSTQIDLPARRAFVVQFNGNSAIGAGQFAGRVEHVSSGRRLQFGSLPELTAFILQTVIENEAPR